MREFAKALHRLLKNWTLPVAIGAGVGLYLPFALLPSLAGAAEVLGPACVRLLPVSLFLTLLVTFAKVDYAGLRPRAWHGAVLGLQLAAVGTLAFLAGRMPPGTGRQMALEALLVCVIAPCATAMPVVTAKLGGNLTQTTAFALLSSLLGALLIPAVFPMLEPERGVEFLPTAMAILRKLAAVLLAPLALGAAIRRWVPGLRRWIEARPNLGFHFWCVSLAITAGITAKNILRSGASPALLAAIAGLALAAAVAQFAAGRLAGRAFGMPVEAGQAMFQKNTGLAIWIANVYLAPLASLGAGCYVLWQNLVNAVQLAKHRHP